MVRARPVGREAASRKYDILSALTAHALAGDATRQRRVLRLVSLITTRYNWARDELCMGQVEIARLWAVDPRTVKREMAALRSAGWLTLKRRGARGRLSVHGLNLDRILADTRPQWPAVGPDFVARMGGEAEAPAAPNVVPLRPTRPATGTVWPAAQAILEGQGLSAYLPWLSPLVEIEAGGTALVLGAPSRFHASYVRTHLMDVLRAAARAADPTIGEVRVEGP